MDIAEFPDTNTCPVEAKDLAKSYVLSIEKTLVETIERINMKPYLRKISAWITEEYTSG